MSYRDKIIPGREYYHRRTGGWKWNGQQRWWEIFVVFYDGMNGVGGSYIEERWRWNNSTENIRKDPRNLGWDESERIARECLESLEDRNEPTNL